MNYLRSVPTHFRIYRGVLESLGTYERLQTAIHTSLYEHELDGNAKYPSYIGASLVSKREFRTLRQENPELRNTTPERLLDDVMVSTPRTKDSSYNVTLRDVKTCGNPREGYTLAATFDSEIFDIEKHAIYRALGSIANTHIPVPEDYRLNICKLPVPFPKKTEASLQSLLPRTIVLEPIEFVMFSERVTQ